AALPFSYSFSALALVRKHCSGSQQRKRITGQVAANSEQHYSRAEQCNPPGREEHVRRVSPAKPKGGVRNTPIGNERQRKHRKGIERERLAQVAMEQRVHRAQRPASGAVPAGQPKKWAWWKQVRCGGIEGS